MITHILHWLTCSIVIVRCVRGCVEFQEIAEDEQDVSYHSINNATDDVRPLGFEKSTVIYQSSEDNPCFTITGKNDQYLEVKFETVPVMQLCVQEKETGRKFCANGRNSICRIFSKPTMSYEFYCKTSEGCAEGDVNFWFRITRGPLPEDDTEGMWCSYLNEQYPESLRPLPPNFTPKPTKPPIGAASQIHVSYCMIFLISLVSILISFSK